MMKLLVFDCLVLSCTRCFFSIFSICSCVVAGWNVVSINVITSIALISFAWNKSWWMVCLGLNLAVKVFTTVAQFRLFSWISRIWTLAGPMIYDVISFRRQYSFTSLFPFPQNASMFCTVFSNDLSLNDPSPENAGISLKFLMIRLGVSETWFRCFRWLQFAAVGPLWLAPWLPFVELVVWVVLRSPYRCPQSFD